MIELNDNKLSFDAEGAEDLIFLIRKTILHKSFSTDINIVINSDVFKGLLHAEFWGETK